MGGQSSKKKEKSGRGFGPKAYDAKGKLKIYGGTSTKSRSKPRSRTARPSAGAGGGPHRGTRSSGGDSWPFIGSKPRRRPTHPSAGSGGGGGRRFVPRPSGGGGSGGRTFGPRPSGGGGGGGGAGRRFVPRPSGGGGSGGGGGRVPVSTGGGDFLGKFRTAHLRGDAHGLPWIDSMTQKTLAERLLHFTYKGPDHYSWYVFPQLAGLGYNPLSIKYAIKNIREAQAFLRDPVLGMHLRDYTIAVLKLLNPGGGGGGRNIDKYARLKRILGPTDAMKFRSSMTLFLEAAKKNNNTGNVALFQAAINEIGQGPDDKTLRLLGLPSSRSSGGGGSRRGGTRRKRRNRNKRRKTHRYLSRRKKQKTRRRKKRCRSRRRRK